MIEPIQAPFEIRLLEVLPSHFEASMAGWGTEAHDLSIGAKLEWQVASQRKTITASLLIGYHLPQLTLLSLVVDCVFEIEEHSWNLVCDAPSKSLALPRHILLQIGTIVVGTARGVLLERTDRIGMQPLLLPLLDVERLIVEEPVLHWD